MKTLFYHGKTVDGNRFTVAGKYAEDNRLNLGVSLCSSLDPFVKATGRKKAEGKLLSNSGQGKMTLLDTMGEDDPGIRVFIDNVTSLNGLTRNELKELFTL